MLLQGRGIPPPPIKYMSMHGKILLLLKVRDIVRTTVPVQAMQNMSRLGNSTAMPFKGAALQYFYAEVVSFAALGVQLGNLLRPAVQETPLT